MKTVDSRRDSLEPLFHVVPFFVVELTIQIMAKGDSSFAFS